MIGLKAMVAVGMAVTSPPLGSVRTELPHTASASGMRRDPQGKDVDFWVLVCGGRQGVSSVTIDAVFAGCDF